MARLCFVVLASLAFVPFVFLISSPLYAATSSPPRPIGGSAPAAPKADITIDVDRTDDNAGATGCNTVTLNDCSLRGAISKANGDTGNLYTIVVPAGTYTITLSGAGDNTNATGDLDINTSLIITGAGATTVVDGNQSVMLDRVFHITGAYSVTIRNLLITNGRLDGAGIFNEGGTLTVRESTITGNCAFVGGGTGITNLTGSLAVLNSTISANCAGAAGGGILNSDTMIVSSSIIASNSALGNYGGGIFNAGVATITNSTLRQNSTGRKGGGIFNDGGVVTIDSGSIITGNTAVQGGAGIANANFLSGSTPGLIISNSTVALNTIASSTSGAGIYNTGEMTVYATNVLTNSANSNAANGGILNSGAITITSSTVSGNYSGNTTLDGAGLANIGGGIATVISSTISNNSSDGGGGGIGNGISASMYVTASTISGNHANDPANGLGGGIRNSGAMTITNSTVSGNTAWNNGGGIYITPGSVNLNNVTITDNTTDDDANGSGNGGGVFNGGTVNMRNTIVAGNTDKGNEVPDCIGAPTSLGYNLIGKSDACGFAATTGDQQGSIASPLDPKLGPLANNGGETKTHALLTGSPAINAGNPAVPGSGGNACAATDQRGLSRPIGTACDIGGYEAGATLYLPLISK